MLNMATYANELLAGVARVQRGEYPVTSSSTAAAKSAQYCERVKAAAQMLSAGYSTSEVMDTARYWPQDEAEQWCCLVIRLAHYMRSVN